MSEASGRRGDFADFIGEPIEKLHKVPVIRIGTRYPHRA
jgi:hypothetical protein